MKMSEKFFLLVSICLCCSVGFTQTISKVLIIGIDGCRADALRQANTPNLDALMANGTFSYHAFTIPVTSSGPGWSAMMTGVWHNKHGVNDNSFNGSNFQNFPHFFNRVEGFNPSLHTASICHWGPINDEIVDLTDFQQNISSDPGVRTAGVNYLLQNDPDVLFLHFDDVDHAGHASGYSPTNQDYLDAIELVDGYAGDLLNALTQRPNYTNENWLILSSTDHGGTGFSHGGSSFEERNIWMIASGDQIPNQEITPDTTITQSGNVLDFNGTDNYATVGNLPLFDFGSTLDFSIEVRVKTSGFSGDPSIVSNKDWDSGNNKGFIISTIFPNGPNWKVNIGDGSNRADLTGSAINDNQWHHLTATFDRDGDLTIYEDGSFVSSTSIVNIGDINTGLSLAFGQDGSLNYPYHFNGIISEVRIFNTVLSGETVASFTCSSVSPAHPNYSNLIGYWKIDEGTGTTFSDSSPNTNNASFSGAAPSWQTNSSQLVCIDISNTPRIIDVAVSALEHLCVPIHPSWELDGKTVGAAANCAVPACQYTLELFDTGGKRMGRCNAGN